MNKQLASSNDLYDSIEAVAREPRIATVYGLLYREVLEQVELAIRSECTTEIIVDTIIAHANVLHSLLVTIIEEAAKVPGATNKLMEDREGSEVAAFAYEILKKNDWQAV